MINFSVSYFHFLLFQIVDPDFKTFVLLMHSFVSVFFDRQRNGSLAPSSRLLAAGRHRQAWLRSMAGYAERCVLHDPQRAVQGRPGQGELPRDEEQVLGASVQAARAGSRDRGAATKSRLPQPHPGSKLSNDDSECQASSPFISCSGSRHHR